MQMRGETQRGTNHGGWLHELGDISPTQYMIISAAHPETAMDYIFKAQKALTHHNTTILAKYTELAGIYKGPDNGIRITTKLTPTQEEQMQTDKLTQEKTANTQANSKQKEPTQPAPTEEVKYKHICQMWGKYGHTMTKELQEYYRNLKAEQHLQNNSSSSTSLYKQPQQQKQKKKTTTQTPFLKEFGTQPSGKKEATTTQNTRAKPKQATKQTSETCRMDTRTSKPQAQNDSRQQPATRDATHHRRTHNESEQLKMNYPTWLATDACFTGGGSVQYKHLHPTAHANWWHWEGRASSCNSMPALETLALLRALQQIPLETPTPILWITDCLPAKQAFIKGYSKTAPFLNDIIQIIKQLIRNRNWTIKAIWVPTKIQPADTWSRRLDEPILTKLADPQPSQPLLDFLNQMHNRTQQLTPPGGPADPQLQAGPTSPAPQNRPGAEEMKPQEDTTPPPQPGGLAGPHLQNRSTSSSQGQRPWEEDTPPPTPTPTGAPLPPTNSPTSQPINHLNFHTTLVANIQNKGEATPPLSASQVYRHGKEHSPL